jgi:hypothetical protein
VIHSLRNETLSLTIVDTDLNVKAFIVKLQDLFFWLLNQNLELPDCLGCKGDHVVQVMIDCVEIGNVEIPLVWQELHVFKSVKILGIIRE